MGSWSSSVRNVLRRRWRGVSSSTSCITGGRSPPTCVRWDRPCRRSTARAVTNRNGRWVVGMGGGSACKCLETVTPTTHHPPPTTHRSLPTAHYPPPTTHRCIVLARARLGRKFGSHLPRTEGRGHQDPVRAP